MTTQNANGAPGGTPALERIQQPTVAAEDVLAAADLARLHALYEDADDMWQRFDREVRQVAWHPFKPADCTQVIAALLPFRATARSFLEWGSAHGVIAIAADIVGFDAYGIEIDERLVEMSRTLAARHGSNAKFAAASFLPEGYEYRSESGDTRIGTIEYGPPGYAELGMELEDFDVVYGYPWGGEDHLMHQLMAQRGGDGAHLLVNGGSTGIATFRVRRDGS